MSTPNWMLYGATGFTGKLLIDEALQRGHRPLLAGRSEAKLKPLAEQHGLDYVAFTLDSAETVAAVLRAASVELVMHAAGPFIHTSQPMLTACLQVGAHYLDLTGEVRVFENTFRHDQQAQDAGVVLMSGVGFDIVPSDCLGKYVADQLPSANRLEIVLDALGASAGGMPRISGGTFKSVLEMLYEGGTSRKNGELFYYPLGAGMQTIRFPHGTFTVIGIPWGDVSAAYHSTGIPNIAAYMTFPQPQAQILRYTGVLGQALLNVKPLRRGIGWTADRLLTGPGEQHRHNSRSHIYARATDPNGNLAEAWVETREGYDYTRLSALLCIERILDTTLSGALTPSAAFGADFALEIDGTIRRDKL